MWFSLYVSTFILSSAVTVLFRNAVIDFALAVTELTTKDKTDRESDLKKKNYCCNFFHSFVW